MSDETCRAKVWNGWHTYPCAKKATREGWCGIHHPDAKQRRRDKSEAKSDARMAEWKSKKETYRRAACYDALIEALDSIASFAVGHGDVCEIIAKRARDVLLAAEPPKDSQ